jgi:phospholipase/carboxylesterase
MSDHTFEIFTAAVPPLVDAMDALLFLLRHLHPPEATAVFESLGDPDAALRAARPRIDELPDALDGVRSRLSVAADVTLTCYDKFRDAAAAGELVPMLRAVRDIAIAQEALYPLAGAFPFVSTFFLPEAQRDDTALMDKVAVRPVPGETGLFQMGADAARRGGFALYVPEYYAPDRDWPLVMALHGGSGDGRRFLWSWLREARAHGAILVTPTALDKTWALLGDDADSPNFARILARIESKWRIDPSRRLLTGLSDGGTFTYVSGLQADSPFTHLAPVAASFHPLLAQAADPARVGGLPIFLTHGSLDWMFPVELARTAQAALTSAGARVTYREIDDLSHAYPREVNAEILAWMAGSRGAGTP